MEHLLAEHFEEFGVKPEIIVSSPARIYLIGEHSSYFKDKILSLSINVPIYVSVSTRKDGLLRFCFPQQKERKRSSVTSVKFRREDKWANSIKSVIYAANKLGKSFSGLNFCVHSQFVSSMGMGVTSAIKTASALALYEYCGFKGGRNNVAQKMMEIGDSEFLGMETIWSDIYTNLYSKKDFCTLTNCNSNEYEHLPFNLKGYSIVITDSRVPRFGLGPESYLYNKENFNLIKSLKIFNDKNSWFYDNDIELSEVLRPLREDVRRGLTSIIKEYQFVQDAEVALKNNNLGGFARCVNKSHEINRDVFQISCPEIDWLVKRVTELDSTSSLRSPSTCSRITGKGLGRCTYAILPTKDVDTYLERFAEYERIFGFHPVSYIVKPSSCASVIKN